MDDRMNLWDAYEGELIAETELPENIKRRLIVYGITTVGDLKDKSEDFLSRIPLVGSYSFGAKRIEWVQKMLQSRGLPRLPRYSQPVQIPTKPPHQK